MTGVDQERNVTRSELGGQRLGKSAGAGDGGISGRHALSRWAGQAREVERDDRPGHGTTCRVGGTAMARSGKSRGLESSAGARFGLSNRYAET